MLLRLGSILATFAGAHAFGFAQQPQSAIGARDMTITVGKSVIVDSPVNIQRVSVGNEIVAEAVAVNPREVLVNGKAPGETSLIVWQDNGNRLFFDVSVRPPTTRADAVQRELDREVGPDAVTMDVQGDAVFLHGTVPDL